MQCLQKLMHERLETEPKRDHGTRKVSYELESVSLKDSEFYLNKPKYAFAVSNGANIS